MNRSNQVSSPQMPGIDGDQRIAKSESAPSRTTCVEVDEDTRDSDVERPVGRLPMRSTLLRHGGDRN